MIEQLATLLQAIPNVKFAEYAWKTRPAGNFGTWQIDYEAEKDTGNDGTIDRAFEGSVDLYTYGKEWLIAAAVETALETVCAGSWYLNSEQYEQDTGLLHREFVFQLERR